MNLSEVLAALFFACVETHRLCFPDFTRILLPPQRENSNICIYSTKSSISLLIQRASAKYLQKETTWEYISS